jgi:hypothetical protein
MTRGQAVRERQDVEEAPCDAGVLPRRGHPDGTPAGLDGESRSHGVQEPCERGDRGLLSGPLVRGDGRLRGSSPGGEISLGQAGAPAPCPQRSGDVHVLQYI